MKIAVVGGGPAGFFAAIHAKDFFPQAEVVILEKSANVLQKVRISGGGRCNVTHDLDSPEDLSKNYPRGEKFLRKCFYRFGSRETKQWYIQKGVKLKTEKDGRMFPVTDNSQTIIDCLLAEAKKLGVGIKTKTDISSITKTGQGFILTTGNNEIPADRVILAGGGIREKSSAILHSLGHNVSPAIPSLFTFTIENSKLRELQGISSLVNLRIQGAAYSSSGSLLVTHWGVSGPAVLKLSSLAAKFASEKNYRFPLLVNWCGKDKETILDEVGMFAKNNPDKKCINANPFAFPGRLWEYLLEKSGTEQERIWKAMPKKNFNRLVEILYADEYPVSGKSVFKDEFVTCGGVILNEVDQNMQSKKVPGLFFAGEILDIDGYTGGFNFQNCWTTGYLAGMAAGKKT